MDGRQILKVLVGSQAHGLATPASDYDYKAVYILPTAELLRIGGSATRTQQIEGGVEADTAFELGHFLSLAVKCNPSVLEIFKAPVVVTNTADVQKLRELFPALWNAQGVANAFIGYSMSQRAELLDNKKGRRWKSAVAYTRVLLQGIELLSTGDFHVAVQKQYEAEPSFRSDWPWFLKEIKKEKVEMGEIISVAERLRDTLQELADLGPFKDQKANMPVINDYLLDQRRDNWL